MGELTGIDFSRCIRHYGNIFSDSFISLNPPNCLGQSFILLFIEKELKLREPKWLSQGLLS